MQGLTTSWANLFTDPDLTPELEENLNGEWTENEDDLAKLLSGRIFVGSSARVLFAAAARTKACAVQTICFPVEVNLLFHFWSVFESAAGVSLALKSCRDLTCSRNVHVLVSVPTDTLYPRLSSILFV
eukprot:g76943.t1